MTLLFSAFWNDYRWCLLDKFGVAVHSQGGKVLLEIKSGRAEKLLDSRVRKSSLAAEKALADLEGEEFGNPSERSDRALRGVARIWL